MRKSIYVLLVFLVISAFVVLRMFHSSSQQEDPRKELKETLFRKFYQSNPKVGAKAPDFNLGTEEGMEISLYELLKDKPSVLEFGNYTCPPFQRRSQSMEALKERYGDRANFVIIYVRESNPGRGIFKDIPQPKAYSERLKLAQKFSTAFKRTFHLLIDDMDNSVCKAYGNPFNATFIIAKDKTVSFKAPWAPPAEVDYELAKLLGGEPRQTRTEATESNSAQMARAELQIGGMVCQGCVIAVRNGLLNVPGVRSAEVNLSKAKAVIKYDKELVDVNKLKAAVEDTGFEALISD
jgi:copper chaperone CopZ/peroxiredoxin